MGGRGDGGAGEIDGAPHPQKKQAKKKQVKKKQVKKKQANY